MIRMALSLFACCALLAVSPAAQTTAGPAAGAAAKPQVVVNLNTATLVELQGLPGIGAKTAERILQYREKHGPFKKIEELMNVQGIGEKSFLKLRSQLTVASTTAGPASQR
jgi:competence protein ComEA